MFSFPADAAKVPGQALTGLDWVTCLSLNQPCWSGMVKCSYRPGLKYPPGVAEVGSTFPNHRMRGGKDGCLKKN